MSCPSPIEWRALLRHRFDAEAAEPAGLEAALQHLDDCPACRRLTASIDPTLAFRALRRTAVGADEAATMRQAVWALRHARELEGTTSSGARPAKRYAGWLLRAAAAAGLALLALQAHAPHPTPLTVAAAPAVSSSPAMTLPAGSGKIVPAADRDGSPLLEETDRPSARVYELGGRDLAVVMVVDKSLDV